ncbi:MAG TPA: hypothetical protein VG326_10405 [Tepidisphaeraceae bacterium]|jgi:hypothetical protein|nr:hypothetical protein [Tepidisphaeraceae bacterium]
MAMKQEANTPIVLTIGAVSGLLVLVIYFGVEAWFRQEEKIEMDAQWENSPNTWLIDMRDSQKVHLGGIDAAMKKVVESGGKLPSTQPASGPAARAE